MNNFDCLVIKNKKIKRLVNINLLISFIICICGFITLIIYNTYYNYISADIFDIGIIIFRTGLFIGTTAIMCGIFFENYLKF